jgi:hypothetical protein
MHREAGETILTENRVYEVYQQENLTVIDQFSRLNAAIRPVTLLADRHSFTGARVHDLIDVEDGGTMIDSEGRVNPSGNYWDDQGERKAPRWVDCSGQIAGLAAGVTLIGHPDNERNEFYVREYGLMTVSAMLGHDVRLTRQDPFHFAARFVAHDGPVEVDTTDRLHAEFAERPITG